MAANGERPEALNARDWGACDGCDKWPTRTTDKYLSSMQLDFAAEGDRSPYRR
ncbi:hypothetical protein [Microcoleus vaginatus]|uniref:hypothetical protein n=1 Tax=Microcoleus vaginatus TaxID=119532 RepID=UPI001683D29F|nr:hypothetical protein [Microcoleus sp. FACHB-84]MBD2009903.1 hypothetical protein [Microcoleus sp. FACHB-45]